MSEVVASMDAPDVASIRVAQRLGMKRAGDLEMRSGVEGALHFHRRVRDGFDAETLEPWSV